MLYSSWPKGAAPDSAPERQLGGVWCVPTVEYVTFACFSRTRRHGVVPLTWWIVRGGDPSQ